MRVYIYNVYMGVCMYACGRERGRVRVCIYVCNTVYCVYDVCLIWALFHPILVVFKWYTVSRNNCMSCVLNYQ